MFSPEMFVQIKLIPCFVIIILLCHSAANGKGLPVHTYHESVGIPRAQEIWMRELRRVVGGSSVSSADIHPHHAGIVTLLTTGQTSICGGSLISRTRVLTAAHCWWDGRSQATQFTVVLGSLTIFSGGTRIVTKDIVVHPNWNTNAITNDIAMARIPAVMFTNSIQAIPLPTMQDVNQNFAGLTATISGFGKTSDAQNSFPQSTALHDIAVTVMTNAACQHSFELGIHNSHMCTDGRGGVGTCDGDSGGPITLVWRNRRTQVGIASFGVGDGCQRNFPSVYTRVTAFLNWINANL